MCAAAPSELYVLGSGIRSVVQFTTETVQALQSSRTVFVLHDDKMVHRFVVELCADTRDLFELYPQVGLRSDVYAQIARVVAEEASRGGTVSFLVHGHPLFLVSAAELLMDRARDYGVCVRVLPGISSLDTIMCELGIDYAYGFQVFDATTLISGGWPVNPDLPAIIFQIATTLNPDIQRDDPDAQILRPLVRHLCRSHAADHPCAVVYSASFILDVPEIRWLPISDLSKRPDLGLWQRPTLYVPGRP